MEERLRLLLAEDDQIDRMAFERHVMRESLPYDYVIAKSVSEARKILAAEQFDAVLIDYLLGDGTAFDLFENVENTPIVVITGSGDEEIAVKAMKAGAYDYLIKDPEGNHLKTLPVTVENAIHRKRAEEELAQYRQDLEQLVAERTAELQRTNTELANTNEQLSAEITERTLTEKALRQAEEEQERLLSQIQDQAQQMQQIVDTVPAGVLLLDANGSILLANPVARQALAVLTNAEEAAPLTHLGPRSLDDVLAHHADPLPIEIVLPESPSSSSAQDARRVFEVQARPIGKSEACQWVLTLREVTRERETQQQMQLQERLATVGQLAAGIAHDFNNILASIVLYSGMMLRSSDLTPKGRERLNIIRQQGHRAANLVQQILDFARRSIIERKPLDLTPFLKELEKLLARTLPETIRLRFDYGSEDYVVNADPTRIQQVVMNLALNARDAMSDGGELRFELSRFQLQPDHSPPLHDMPPGEWVLLTVTDNGTGISPEATPHIFEPFFTTKEVGKGTGLGLAQVYGIVRQHEGYIGFESEVGSGTTFSIYLPHLTPPDVPLDEFEEKGLAQGHGETILVVEDDSTAREAVGEILRDLGYQVLTAADGQEALALYSSDIALVLSDLVMPQMGGGALHAALKERDPTIKTIVISGYPLTDGDQVLREQGITTWIRKPFSANEIAQVVRETLEENTVRDS